MQAEPRAVFVCTHEAGIKSRIAALDRHLFGAADSPHPSLAALDREIETALRQPADDLRETSNSALASLDGPMCDRAASSALKRFKLKGAR